MKTAKPFTKEDILRAHAVTKSAHAAARYLRCSYQHYIKYAKIFTNEDGITLLEAHKNPSGKGIPKFLTSKGKFPAIEDIITGVASIDSFEPAKIRDKLIAEGYLREECYMCSHAERRVIDFKMPLIVHFKDGNKRNWGETNTELLCYNCYFLYVGDIFTAKQIKGLEDYKPPYKADTIDWELDDVFKEHLMNLGLMDGTDENDGSEYISRKK